MQEAPNEALLNDPQLLISLEIAFLNHSSQISEYQHGLKFNHLYIGPLRLWDAQRTCASVFGRACANALFTDSDVELYLGCRAFFWCKAFLWCRALLWRTAFPMMYSISHDIHPFLWYPSEAFLYFIRFFQLYEVNEISYVDFVKITTSE